MLYFFTEISTFILKQEIGKRVWINKEGRCVVDKIKISPFFIFFWSAFLLPWTSEISFVKNSVVWTVSSARGIPTKRATHTSLKPY